MATSAAEKQAQDRRDRDGQDVIGLAKSQGFDPPVSDYNCDDYDETRDALDYLARVSGVNRIHETDDAEMLAVISHGLDVPEMAPSIPERVTAVQARLQTLLDTVKIMSIQLGAWERAMETADADVYGGRYTDAAMAGGVQRRMQADADDAASAVTATIEKLEKGTY